MKRLMMLLLVLPVMAMAADIGAKPITNPALEEAGKWVYSGRELWDKLERNLAAVKQPKPYEQISFEQCGMVNAFYNEKNGKIIICYELVDRTIKQAKSKGQSSDSAFGALVFVVFHEYGHALINQNEGPVLGREEDAADQVAAILARKLGLGIRVLNGLAFVSFTKVGPIYVKTQRQMADEHSFDEQRRANVICWLAGDRQKIMDLAVINKHLTPDRAARCQREQEKAEAAVTAMVGR